MYSKQKIIIVAACIIGTADAATIRQRPFFQSSRALTMGDAYTAYNAGFEAVYYNPAGVAKRHKPQMKYFDLELKGTPSVYQYISDSVSSLGALSNLAEFMVNNPDTNHAMGLSFLPQFIVRNFSIGIVLQSYYESRFDSASALLDVFAFTDAALYVQYGFSLWGGIVKFGLGGKALNRAELERRYDATQYSQALSFATEWQEGIGYGYDVGLMVTYPGGVLPTLGISVQDVGDTNLLDRRILFTGASGRPGAPPPLPQKVNVGLSAEFKHAAGSRSIVSLEMKDVEWVSRDWQERLHLGWELNVDKTVYLRAGVNQGRYWTAGAGVFLAGVGLELGTYGENLLAYSGSRRDDRKYVGRYVLSF